MLNQLTLKRRSAVDLERTIKVVRFFLASVFEILLKVPMNGEKGRLGQIVIFLKLVANVFDESRPGRVLDDVVQQQLVPGNPLDGGDQQSVQLLTDLRPGLLTLHECFERLVLH